MHDISVFYLSAIASPDMPFAVLCWSQDLSVPAIIPLISVMFIQSLALVLQVVR